MKLYCEHTVLPNGDQIQIKAALLTIEGTQIQSVQEWDSPLKDLPKDTVHLKDKMLSPAFVNAHTHLSMSFFRSIDSSSAAGGNMVTDLFFKLERKMSADDVRAFSRMGAYECLNFGIGTVWDHYYHGEAIAKALCDTGLTGVIAPTLQDLEGPAKDAWEREWAHTQSIHSSQEFSKQGVVAAWGPHATDTVSANLMKKIQEQASKDQIPIHMHLAQCREEYYKRMASENLSPVTFLKRMHIFDTKTPLVFAHGLYLRDEDLDILSKHPQSHLVSCPSSQMIFDFPAPLTVWESRKIQWLVGTDTVASNDSMNLQKELRMISGFPLQELSYSENYRKFREEHSSLEDFASQREKIWKKSKVFRDPSYLLNKVWNKAGSLHPKLKVGVIAPKSFANLVVWDLDHPSFWPAKNLRALAFNDSTSAIHNMLMGGKWVSKDGAFAEGLRNSTSYKEALKEAKERLNFLLKSL